jgi:2-dehydropantoate 2-reductase
VTTSNDVHIGIVGAGSIGCFIGGCLAASGASVTMVGRSRLKQQIEQTGLHITDYTGREHKLTDAQLCFTTSMDDISNADYILLTVKSGDTQEAAKAIAPIIKQSAIIVSFQNGVKNTDVLKVILPKHQVVKAMVPFNVLNTGAGHFHRGTEGDLALEANIGEHQLLIDALTQAQLPVSVYDDLTGVQWGKLIMNLNNSVNALSGIPLVEQLNDREYRRIMAKVVSEALTVMKVAGIEPARTGKVIPKLTPYILSLPNFLFKKIAAAMLKIDPKARSSMYEDFKLKRKTEIDFLNGEILNLAQLQGIDAPINQAIVNLVKEAENKKQGSPKYSAEFLKQAVFGNQ